MKRASGRARSEVGVSSGGGVGRSLCGLSEVVKGVGSRKEQKDSGAETV